MSFDLVTEPIGRWPDPDTRQRRVPPFTVGYDDTVELLSRELAAVGARGEAVIQVVTHNGANDLRRDGLLRAQTRIEHPGVRLSFESKHGPLTYATDAIATFGARQGWQQNLRAIALGLQALRAVDRYGITKTGEQYRGWLAIEAPTAPRPMDVLERWARGSAAFHRDMPVEGLARLARIAAHPDRHGGDRTGHDAVLAAAAALGVQL